MAALSKTSSQPAEDLEPFVNDVLDWQYNHGSLLKIPPDTGNILARPIGVALYPSPFPKELFERAMEMQGTFDKLYIAISRDEAWLAQVLSNLINSDTLVGKLWKIHQEAKRKRRGVEPPLSMAFFRSDYMLHVPHIEGEPPPTPQLKQVEFNTFSLAGGVHSAKASQMHEYFNNTGSYPHRPLHSYDTFPPNPTPSCMMHALLTAHVRYGSSRGASNARRTAIIMTVQPNNVNICDERPIEELLWKHDVPTFHLEFGQPILDTVSLGPDQELLFRHPQRSEVFEVSVVYHRAGYDEEEYDATGIAARLRLEQSRAIQCPSMLTQLAGSKKVQQELALPGVLERFITPEEAMVVRETFMPMYPLDESEAGREGRDLALNPATALTHVLKPSNEGGGHNTYGSAIPAHLSSVRQEAWPEYILMEMIRPPSDIHNSLISFRGLRSGPVISELGIFGMCLWQADKEGKLVIEEEGQGCFSFKSKPSYVDEISVVKGYGCFDSPWLV